MQIGIVLESTAVRGSSHTLESGSFCAASVSGPPPCSSRVCWSLFSCATFPLEVAANAAALPAVTGYSNWTPLSNGTCLCYIPYSNAVVSIFLHYPNISPNIPYITPIYTLYYPLFPLEGMLFRSFLHLRLASTSALLHSTKKV